MPAAVRTRPDACPGVFAPHDAADGALARIRLPGGAIDAAALRVVADCADELGDGHLHLTSRGNLQLRGLSRSAALVARLSAAGLLPSVTHERVRNVLASPLSGIVGDPVARVVGCGPGSSAGSDDDPRPRVVSAATGAAGTRGSRSAVTTPQDDPRARVEGAATGAVSTRANRSPDVLSMAVELDRELCARPGLAALPGRFLFALDDGRADVAAEGPDLCWQAPGVLLVAGVPVAQVAAADAVAVLLDAAEAFLSLRAADGCGAGDGRPGNQPTDGGGAWRAAELVDAPARIAAALIGGAAAGLSRSGEPAGSPRGAGSPPGPDSGSPPGPSPGSPPSPGHRSPPGRAGAGTASAVGADASGSRPVPAAGVPGPVVRADGGVALVVAPVLGKLTTAQARLLADVGPTLVVTPWRTLVLPHPQVSAADLAAAGLVVEPGPAADVSACAGRPGCAKALADVRADALAALSRMSSETDLAAGRVHVSGCARRCGAPRGPHVDAVALAAGGYLVDGVARNGLLG